MRHLEAVANGDVTGACEFFKPGLLTGTVTDERCAQTIGLSGKSEAIEASIAKTKFSIYNGFTLASSVVDRQPAGWILDRGHFRNGNGYKLA